MSVFLSRSVRDILLEQPKHRKTLEMETGAQWGEGRYLGGVHRLEVAGLGFQLRQSSATVPKQAVLGVRCC